MSSLGQIFEASLNGTKDSEISSRRLITIVIMLTGVIIDIAIIALAFMVAFRSAKESGTAIDALTKLIYLTIITKVTILLLIGIITWQNVNDTVSLVKGVPINNVAKAADEIQEKAQDIKEAVQQGAPADTTPKSTTA